MAIAWQVYDLSNSASALSLVGVAWTLPQVLTLLLSGVLADRVERRRQLLAADLLRCATIGGIAALSALRRPGARGSADHRPGRRRSVRVRRRELRPLFAGLRVAPLGLAEGEQAGAWRRDFAGSGVSLTQADCLIAAAALSVGARLATGNAKDFPMPGLHVEVWAVGE